MYSKKTAVTNHIKDNAAIYFFMVVLFLIGVVFGAIIVNSMNFTQRQDLIFYLERFFGLITDKQQIDNIEIFKSSILYHAKYLLLFFILGLSIIGLPIVWILLFLKGLVVGFSVGFIVNHLGLLKGLLFASLSIAPQNMIIIPIYIIASCLSMIFSLTLLKKLFTHGAGRLSLPPFGAYISIFSLLILTSFIAAGMEAFVSNEAMEMLIKSFYKQ